jgi:hypothetical protein
MPATRCRTLRLQNCILHGQNDLVMAVIFDRHLTRDVMPRTIVAILMVLIVTLSLSRADDKDSSKTTPAQRPETLIQEVQYVSDDLANAKTDEEKKSARERLQTLPRRLSAVAEENPQDPAALDALIQTVAWVNGTAFPAGGMTARARRSWHSCFAITFSTSSIRGV